MSPPHPPAEREAPEEISLTTSGNDYRQPRREISRGPAVACPDCGLLQRLPAAQPGEIAECRRCTRVLAGAATGRVDLPLALCAAALLLLVPAAIAPLMSVSTYGAHHNSGLSSSAQAIWADGFPSLGLLIGSCGIGLPVAYLVLVTWVLAVLHRRQTGPRPGIGSVFRWTKHLRPWVMLEVYLVGCFVAYSRINVVASVDVGLGGWCLLASTLVMLLALTQLDERTVWEAIPPYISARPGAGESPVTSAVADAALVACTVCDLVVHDKSRTHCPRCHARMHHRKPDSWRRTTALVIAGYLLYIPANTLPVLTIVRFGHEDPNTILSGVFELIDNDLWPLAVIIFTASVVLPLTKLCGLTWMLVGIRQRSAHRLVARTRLYRMIDVVGRWSNIDVFMVGLLVALLQFGAVTSVHAGNGLVAFAAVVVITMIATSCFDARLMWDAPGRADG